METRVEYTASPTLVQFHKAQNMDKAFVRGIRGPIGSGKSVGMCLEIMRRATEQVAYKRVRRSRWVVIRNTYRELVDTTIKTWFDWVPESLGNWSQQNMTFTIKSMLPDGTALYLEVLFRALDKPTDVKKLLSLEVTGGWINEAKEVPKAVLDMLQGRVGRYPSKRQGGPSWFGVIMDTNSPDTDHWWYRIFEEHQPDNWMSFHQPSGVSEEAENVENLPAKYYTNMMSGKDKEWINVYVHGKYGMVMDGQPIYPEYNDDVHFCHDEIEAVPDEPLHIGIDFGLTPAALIGQKINGQWRIIDELITDGVTMGAYNFGTDLGQHLRSTYRGFEMIITGDPAGEQRAQTDERTPFEILDAVGISADPAHTNDFVIRREAFALPMTRMVFNGQPGLIVGPNCKMLRKGLAGGYKYRRLQVSGDEKFVDKPDKNRYSHICEAGQYLMLGAGEDDTLLGNDTQAWDLDYSDLDRAAV